ncbi:hypothetical protein [Nocardia sp. alder85J]|uniref:hypothetical protein n=1 Tax=Nocardia sp. alder85J TaxID=2862949 RepID=UPI001CD705B4|nr:hypothetical protein [Nocardia sp. alder85J]MCX4095896.1 hypothetical protein [Nocardia sp. alder85J]
MNTNWSGSEPSDPVGVLTRWETAGAVWRVIDHRGDRVTVGLYPCTGGEEVDRFTSADRALLHFLGDRRGSDD